MSPGYLFRVKRASEVHWNPGHLHGEKPNLYVKIYQDSQQVHRTATVKRSIEPAWDGDVFTVSWVFLLSASSSNNTAAVISMKLFHDATLSMFGDRCLSALDIQLHSLLSLCTADGGSKGSFFPPIRVFLAHVEFRC
ncbi:hypothetical protein C8J57DRAFT_1212593 [Mycena rebaudengoi]|nr:hypothetical protein C8J57DRAFT_1212593 [Mycena rebaudengoi]